jgi:phosphoenolpyruvate-protein kinase (PTS system EI component)
MTERTVIAAIIAAAIVIAAWIMKPQKYELRTNNDTLYVIDTANGRVWVGMTNGELRQFRREGKADRYEGWGR